MTEEEKKKLTEPQKATEQPTVANGATVAPEVTPQPSESQRYLDQIIAQYDERKRQNEEADRRDRRGVILNGIGDMAHAISNLYFTTQYAPNSYQEGLSEKSRARYEKVKAERDKNLDQWLHYNINVAGKKQDAEQAEKARQDKLEQQRAAAEAKAKEKQDKEDLQWVTDNLVPDWLMEYDKQGDVAKAQEAISAELEEALKNGTITEGQYKAAKKKLVPVLKGRHYDLYEADRKQSQKSSTTNGKGGGSKGGNIYTYIDFADGSGLNINKNDIPGIAAMYSDLPDNAKLTKKNNYGDIEIVNNPDVNKAYLAVRAYLAKNRNAAMEEKVKQLSHRWQQPRPQQAQQPAAGKYSNVKKKGAKTDYTHVNKK